MDQMKAHSSLNERMQSTEKQETALKPVLNAKDASLDAMKCQFFAARQVV